MNGHLYFLVLHNNLPYNVRAMKKIVTIMMKLAMVVVVVPMVWPTKN